jgi:hypothetical protein
LILITFSEFVRAAERGGLGVGLGRDDQGRPSLRTVTAGGAAEKAGAKAGDLLIAVNGKPIEQFTTADELLNELQGDVGSVCKLTVDRNGRQIELAITRMALGNAPGPAPGPVPNPAPRNPLAVAPIPAGTGQEVPDPNPLLSSLPEAAKAGPPPIIKRGTRVTYFGASGSVSGARTQLVLDANGNWINTTTGEKYAEKEISGGAGAGYNIVRVGHVDRELVALSSSLYVYDPASRSSSYSAAGGMVTNAGFASDYWVNPGVLNNLKETNQNGMRIFRMPYTVNNRRYNAIRFQTPNSAFVYDLESGLLIFHTSSAQGAAVLVPGANDLSQVAAGSTQIVTGWLVDVQDVQVPWKDAPAPPWVADLREMRFEGTQSVATMGVGQFDRPVVLVATIKARGPNWVRFVADMTLQTPQGLPPEQVHADGATGPATLGGLWIAPQALANIERGKVLDINEVTNTRTTVSDIGAAHVTISETGPRHRLDMMYDKSTGALSGLILQQQNGPGTTTLRLRLAGTR